MKTISQCIVGDELFRADSAPVKIIEIQSNSERVSIRTNTGDRWQEYKATATQINHCMTRGYLTYCILFTTRSEMLRHKKQCLMNDLRKLKTDAQKRINEIKKFRLEHFDYLNEYCTEPYIKNLERQAS